MAEVLLKDEIKNKLTAEQAQVIIINNLWLSPYT